MVQAAQQPPSFAGGRLEARRLLGEGGFGVVYEAYDRDCGERVAVKTLSRFGAARLAQFKREFRALEDVSHPNLVQLRELIEDSGEFALVMELVEGAPLLEHLEGRGRELETLCDLFTQLAAALVALHGRQLLHRDLKPSNVLVTPEGQLVVLDFGLVTDLSSPSASWLEQNVGSAAYVPPEQLLGGRAGPPGDLYAVGVLLYEALTGQLPFHGSPREVALKKELGALPSITDRNPDAPQELVALCQDLLQADPDARPDAPTLLERLCELGAARQSWELTAPSGEAPFTGRHEELSLLETLHDRALGGQSQLALLQGEAGIGKSALITEHLRRQATALRSAWLLRGRCYERETVSYKAFDGVVEELARELASLPEAARRPLLPGSFALLQQLFPSLSLAGEAPQAGASQGAAHGEQDRSRLRDAAFEALAELLRAAASRYGLVIVIDELQWSDRESLLLLRELVERCDEAPVFWLVGCRPDDELPEPVLETVDVLRARGATTALQLRGLGQTDARALAERLLTGAREERAVARVVEQAQGHPLLLGELASYRATRELPETDALSVDTVVAARAALLPPQARALLNLIAVSAVPRPRALYARLLRLDERQTAALITTLRTLRMVAVGRKGAVRCYHDRLRRTVVAQLDASALRDCHRRLAEGLAATPGVDPTEVGCHWEQAGEPARALPLLRWGAKRAFDACAFHRAAELYERVHNLGQDLLAPDELTELAIQRARALGAAGHHAAAAALYRASLPSVAGREARALQAELAQHLLKAGEYQRGIQAADALLGELGEPLPRSAGGAVAKLLWHRACLKLRRVPEVTVGEAELDADTATKLRVLQGLTAALSWLDLFRGAELSARHLRLARKARERNHLALALASEAIYLAFRARRVPQRTHDMLARAAALAAEDPRPEVRGVIALTRAQVGMCEWRGEGVAELLYEAEQLLAQGDPSYAWTRTIARSFLLNTLAVLTRHREHAEHAERWMRQAESHGDHMAQSHLVLLGNACFRWLRHDDPARAQAELQRALAPWRDGARGLPQVAQFLSTCHMLQYVDAERCYAESGRLYEQLMRAPVTRPPFVRATVLYGRLVRCVAAGCAARGEARRRRFDEAQRLAEGVRRLHPPTAFLIDLETGVMAAAAGETERARPLLQAALLEAVARGGAVWRRQATLALAFCEGGQAWREARAQELAWIAAQGFANPGRALPWMQPLVLAA